MVGLLHSLEMRFAVETQLPGTDFEPGLRLRPGSELDAGVAEGLWVPLSC